MGPGLSTPRPGSLENTAPNQAIAIKSVTVEGGTIFPQTEFDAAVAPLVGPAVSLRDIEGVRLDLVKKYRDAGYPLISVQATRHTNGALLFMVYEGRITDVKLDGEDIGPAATQVMRFLKRLTHARPIDARTLERYLLLAQDVPGIGLQAVLKPSDTEPGAMTLVATVRRNAVSGMYTVDNRAYKLTGPIEGLGSLNFNSFTSLGERTELTLFHTFDASQLFGQVASEFFVGDRGLRIRLYGGAGSVVPGGFLNDLGYEGLTTVAGIQATYPVMRAREQTLNILGGFDMLDSLITTAPFAGGSRTARSTASNDSLRIFRVGADYALRDVLIGDTLPGVNSVTARISHGVSGLGATHNTNTPARQDENAGFMKLSGEISRNQTLYNVRPGMSVSVLGQLAGQFSNDILPPAEKFFLGGSRFTRGYYSGEASGDNAMAATAELQLNVSNELPVFGKTYDINTQYYLFYDYGYAWQNLKTDADKLANSFGLGARVQVTQNVEVDLEGVRRLTREIDGVNAKELGAYVLYWRVLTRF